MISLFLRSPHRRRLGSARGLIAALGLALAACAPQQWVKPGADAATVQQDFAQCEEEARRFLWSYGPLSLLPPRWLLGRGDPFWSWHDPYQERFAEEYRLKYFCLRSRGYNLVPVQQ